MPPQTAPGGSYSRVRQEDEWNKKWISGAYSVQLSAKTYLNVDTVELVEAGPSATLREATEELPHELVVKVVPAVEHHAIDAEGLAQILGGLGLAGTFG